MFTPELQLGDAYQHSTSEVKSGGPITFNPILRSDPLGYWRGESVFDFKPFKVDGRLGQILLIKYNLADIMNQDFYIPAGDVDPFTYWVQLEKEEGDPRVFLQYDSDRFRGVVMPRLFNEHITEFREWIDPYSDSMDRGNYILFPPTTDFSKIEISVENP